MLWETGGGEPAGICREVYSALPPYPAFPPGNKTTSTSLDKNLPEISSLSHAE